MSIEQVTIFNKRLLDVDVRIYGTAEHPLFIVNDIAHWLEYLYSYKVWYDEEELLQLVLPKDIEHIYCYLRITDIKDPSLLCAIPTGETYRYFVNEEGLNAILSTHSEKRIKRFKKKIFRLLKRMREELYMNKNVEVVYNQEVLGREFIVYGTVDEPLFLAKDVAEWIEYDGTSVGQMLNLVDEDEKVKIFGSLSAMNNVPNPAIPMGPTNRWFLTEDGLYEVLMQSRKPIAKQFKKKVKEILKQIRQTGGYIPVTEEMTDAEIMARAYIIAQKTIEEKTKVIEQQSKAIIELEPKADWFDKFMNSEGLYTSTQIAKMLNYSSAAQLNKELNAKAICYKKGTAWVPYCTTDPSWYKVITWESNGKSGTQLKFTPQGVVGIANLLNVELREELF